MYRSGHNELDSKSSCPQGHVGSNPTVSARTKLKSPINRRFFNSVDMVVLLVPILVPNLGTNIMLANNVLYQSCIHVFMFDDRLEINSLGGMYGGGFVQKLDLRKVPSRRRNPLIADVFARLHYMERKGSGFGKILDAYLNAPNNLDNRTPIFESDNNDFRLVLPNLNYHSNNIFDNADIVNIISDNLKGKQKIVYDTICKNNGINRSDLVYKTGLKSNEIKNAIDKLAKKELIEFKGNNTIDGKYYVK